MTITNEPGIGLKKTVKKTVRSMCPLWQDQTQDCEVHALAVEMAGSICRVFQYHDQGHKDEAIEAMYTIDFHQFAHLSEDDAQRASTAYIDALWAKDDLEADYIDQGETLQPGLALADWSPIEEHLARRADIVGMDSRYATRSVEAWRKHKTGGDYWTPIQEAQKYELRAALQDPAYPEKPKYGQAGHGPEAARYAVAIELHDMHSDRCWDQARDLMIPYYERILIKHREPNEQGV